MQGDKFFSGSSASLMVLVGQLDPLCSSQVEIMSRTEEDALVLAVPGSWVTWKLTTPDFK